AVLLPDCDADDALEMAWRMVAEIRACGLPHRASSVGDTITVSVGAASMRPARGGRTDDLLRAADAALYRAKASCRNRALPALMHRSSASRRAASGALAGRWRPSPQAARRGCSAPLPSMPRTLGARLHESRHGKAELFL